MLAFFRGRKNRAVRAERPADVFSNFDEDFCCLIPAMGLGRSVFRDLAFQDERAEKKVPSFQSAGELREVARCFAHVYLPVVKRAAKRLILVVLVVIK